jgi:hypothetical protein
MTGRAEVGRLERQLDATFDRIKSLGPTADFELQSDFARYLCVLVSGYLEKSIAELLLEHARSNGGATLQRFVDSNTRRFTNANSRRIMDLLASFHPDWHRDVAAFLVDDSKDAVDSVIGLRNNIAHGGAVGVTYNRIHGYYLPIKKVVARIADLCCP